MEETQDAPEVLETPETEPAATEEVAQTTEEVVEQDERDKRIAELEDVNKKLFERAKKAEAKKAVPSKEDLSPKDLYTLMEAKVPQEDVDEVARLSKVLNLSIADTLKSTIAQNVLSERAEERTTANATQTRGGARGSSKVSGEDLLAQAEKTGEVPDTDEGMKALFQARMARRAKS